jgi:predicted outer membrane repeat protein
MRKQQLATMLTALLVLSTGAGAAVIRVPADQPTIRHAMEAAVNGDTVLVADGTWTGLWNNDLDFFGKAITVESENGPAACIIDCQSDGRGFIFQSGEDQTSVLQGFTIANGLHGLGGAIHCTGASPIIRNMIISGCRATYQGGGIYCENGSPDITACVIDDCLSDYNGGGIYCLGAAPSISNCTISNNDNTEHYPYEGYGGGIACFASSSPIITETTFTGNHADNHGGGLYCEDGSVVVIRNCLFEMNTAEVWGGGAYCWASGSLEITGCSFIENESLYTSGSKRGGLQCSAPAGLIADNLIRNNIGCGLSCGGYLLVTRNTITDNTGGSGIDANGSTTISENVITGNTDVSRGGGINCNGYATVISNNTITGNQGNRGGGIYCDDDNQQIVGNLIADNVATENGGGIATYVCQSTAISNNLIIGNSANKGGGIFTGPDTTASFINNLVANNRAGRGGGIACEDADPYFWNMTVTGNTATQMGGGLHTFNQAIPRVINSILWGNNAPEGRQIYVSDDGGSVSRLSIRYSNVEGGQDDIPLDPGCTLGWGSGMIDADPLFASGPLGDLYLSQTAAGQPETSPCVDGGDPSAGIVEGTTRTDEVPDENVADMGYHYVVGSGAPLPLIIAGLGPSPANPPRIRVFPPQQDAVRITAFQPYNASKFGVNVTCGDVDGDQLDEILTGPGPGPMYGPHVRGFDVDTTPLPGLSFLAYGTNKFGVNIAAGDFDGDGFDEIITGAGPGAVFGPHVRGWNYDGSGLVTAVAGINFFAYNTPKWGVNVTAGDIDGDGYDEIVTGTGPGPVYGAHVRGWNVDGGTATAIPGISYFAYNTPRYGVRVGCGDIDGDGMDEIITAPGPSPAFGAHIRGWNYDGSALAAMPGVSFFAWPPEDVFYGGCISSGTDLNGDSRDEIVVGAGPDPSVDTMVKVFTFDGSGVSFWFSLQAFPDGWTHGATVAAGWF